MKTNNSNALTPKNKFLIEKKKRRSESHMGIRSKRPAIPYLGWMLVFTIVPLLMVLYYAFTDDNGAFTLDNFANIADYSHIFL